MDRWRPLSGWHGLPYQEESIGAFSKAPRGIEQKVMTDKKE